MKASITREYRFEMGHALANHKGKCFNPHGHNYRVEVEFSGPIDKTSGMVVDFDDIDNVMKPYIDTEFDHRFWCNDEDPRFADDAMFGFARADREVTAETIALWTWEMLQEFQKSGHRWKKVKCERVTVWETDKASATIRGS